MPAEVSNEQRRPARGAHPPEPENLPCPRCESTNTKFCYYNNYNLSQPRYFCKSCRRYWTRGGSLRNIPVGGGTRKSSKRSRSSSSCSSSTPPQQSALTAQSSFVINTPTSDGPAPAVPLFNGPGPGSEQMVVKSEAAGMMVGSTCSPLRCDVNLNEALPGSFTSLLSAGSSGFLGLSGYGIGLGNGSGFDDVGFGLPFGSGKGEWPLVEVGDHNGGAGAGGSGGGSNGNYGGGGAGGSGNGGCNTWQLNGVDGGLMDGGDCFPWPDLAISTPGTGLE